jgi:hypothetical protein
MMASRANRPAALRSGGASEKSDGGRSPADTGREAAKAVKNAADAIKDATSRLGRATAFPVLTVPTFEPDGGVSDLARPGQDDIDFAAMANVLSKIARFNGIYRCPAYSVAQHSVMGADAVFTETGDAILAGYFVLHDGHEYLLGDWTRPAQDALVYHAREYCRADERSATLAQFVEQAVRKAFEMTKATLDAVIWQRAGIPPIDRMPAYQRQVKAMDERMLRAEGLALFGAKAAPHLPAADMPAPRLTGAIRPWGAMKAEEAFLDRLHRYLGIEARSL